MTATAESPVHASLAVDGRWTGPSLAANVFRLQRTRRSVPGWQPCRERYLAAHPPTEAEWEWLVENYKLVVFLCGKFGAPHARFFEDTYDMVGYVLPTVFYALRMYRPESGYRLSTYLATAVRRALSPLTFYTRSTLLRRGRHCGGYGPVRVPVALGHADVLRRSDLRRVEESEADDTELYDALAGALARLKPVRREVLDRYLGLTRPRETLKQISEDLHVTRERVRQIVLRGMQDVADLALGGRRVMSPAAGRHNPSGLNRRAKRVRKINSQ